LYDCNESHSIRASTNGYLARSNIGLILEVDQMVRVIVLQFRFLPRRTCAGDNRVGVARAPPEYMERARRMDTDQQYVIFQLANTSYALDIATVQEIIRLPALTQVPQALPYVVGITNLRGSIVPVLDLRQRCGLVAGSPTPATRVVVVQQGSHNLGLIVDAVDEVTTIPITAIEPVASVVQDARAQRLLLGVARLEERLVLLLDLSKVAQDQEEALAALTVA
jgi:purine-binding chemotaxis protein CheW